MCIRDRKKVCNVWNGYYGDSEIEKVLDRQTVLKRWIAMEMCWYRNVVSHLSAVHCDALLLISVMNLWALSTSTPNVSTATRLFIIIKQRMQGVRNSVRWLLPVVQCSWRAQVHWSRAVQGTWSQWWCRPVPGQSWARGGTRFVDLHTRHTHTHTQTHN